MFGLYFKAEIRNQVKFRSKVIKLVEEAQELSRVSRARPLQEWSGCFDCMVVNVGTARQ